MLCSRRDLNLRLIVGASSSAWVVSPGEAAAALPSFAAGAFLLWGVRQRFSFCRRHFFVDTLLTFSFGVVFSEILVLNARHKI